ncbi:hypothetical protein CSA37_01120 [Candidatus Fermentibacteria bacterium]|nr:MAG: hypothetical protein CSA37_01120 [Candidatus Fermentibacteria bacterium]
MKNILLVSAFALSAAAGSLVIDTECMPEDYSTLEVRAQGAVLAVVEAVDGVFPGTIELKDSYFVAPEGCVSCQLCVNACPVQAISMDDNNKAVIDPELCINCGICAGTCPVGTIFPSDSAVCELYGIDAEGNETLLQEGFEED